jgi:hypothetical protein
LEHDWSSLSIPGPPDSEEDTPLTKFIVDVLFFVSRDVRYVRRHGCEKFPDVVKRLETLNGESENFSKIESAWNASKGAWKFLMTILGCLVLILTLIRLVTWIWN